MTNKEKFRDEIENLVFSGRGFGVVEGKLQICDKISCSDCDFIKGIGSCIEKKTKWLTSEYKEPEKKKIDLPDDIAVDTPIYVNDEFLEEPWLKRHFKCFRDGKVVTFSDGRTSWSDDGYDSEWECAKLPDDK